MEPTHTPHAVVHLPVLQPRSSSSPNSTLAAHRSPPQTPATDRATLLHATNLLLDDDVDIEQIAQELTTTPGQLAEWSSLPRLQKLFDTLSALWTLRAKLMAVE